MSQEIILHCPECSQHDTPKLYVNVEAGLFNCFRCGFKGKLKKLYKYPELISSLEDKISLSEFNKLKSFKPLDVSNIDVLEDLNPVREIFYQDAQYEYLLNRGWSDDLIGIYRPLLSLNPKYKDRVILPVIKNEKIIYWTARSIISSEGMKYKNPSVSRSDILFESKLPESKLFPEDMVICEGYFDGFKVPQAISLFGKTITAENELNILELASSKTNIYISLDFGAEKEIQTICEKLKTWMPSKKIYFINTKKYEGRDLGDMSKEFSSFELLAWIKENSSLYCKSSLSSQLRNKLFLTN